MNIAMAVLRKSSLDGKAAYDKVCNQKGASNRVRFGDHRSKLVSRMGDISMSANNRLCDPDRLNCTARSVRRIGVDQGSDLNRAKHGQLIIVIFRTEYLLW